MSSTIFTKGPGDFTPPDDAAEEAYAEWLESTDMIDVLDRDTLTGLLLEDTDPAKLDAALREVWAGVCRQAADDADHDRAMRREEL